MTTPQCTARFGGLFDENISSTWHRFDNLTAPGFHNVTNTDESDTSRASFTGTDDIQFGTDQSINDFAFGLDHGGTLSSGASLSTLGLGFNSNLLDTLYSAKMIQARTWSMFQGWSGAEASQQMDGSIIFGGYDEAKVTGRNVTLPIQYETQCASGFIMPITNIVMNLKNGSSPSILGSSRASSLKACIDPKGNALSLPYEIASNFQSVTNSTVIGRSSSAINFFNMLVLADGA